MKSCTFIGHHDCPYDTKEELSLKIESLIVKYNVRTFYVGTHGRFDELVYSVLCDLEIKYDIKFFVVLAYLNTSGNKIYDTEKTMFPEELCNTIKRYAIIKRNEYMIKKYDDFRSKYLEHKMDFFRHPSVARIDPFQITDNLY